MCRLIVWDMVRDPVPDVQLQAGKYERGMVVAVLEDGQDPGSDVWKLGWWRVVDLPGTPRDDMEYLTHPMPASADKTLLPRKRWNILDMNALPVSLDGSAVVSSEVSVQLAQSTATYLSDPTQIGTDPQVIG